MNPYVSYFSSFYTLREESYGTPGKCAGFVTTDYEMSKPPSAVTTSPGSTFLHCVFGAADTTSPGF